MDDGQGPIYRRLQHDDDPGESGHGGSIRLIPKLESQTPWRGMQSYASITLCLEFERYLVLIDLYLCQEMRGHRRLIQALKILALGRKRIVWKMHPAHVAKSAGFSADFSRGRRGKFGR